MRKAGTVIGFLALGLVASTSWAGSWGDYAASFPLFPCQDGWLGCVVDGDTHNSDMSEDSKGFPISSSDRVGWHDLKPTGVFSPFPGLSVYSGELEVIEPPPERVDPAPPNGGQDTTTETQHLDPVVNNNGGHGDKSLPDHNTVEVVEPDPVDTREVVVSNNSHEGERKLPNKVLAKDPEPQSGPKTVTTPQPVVLKNDGVVAVNPVAKTAIKENAIMKNATQTKVDPGASDSCDVLTKLEPKAMLGKLTKPQVVCLEGRLGKEAKQTGKDKISRILMANAYASGDKRTWEKLVKRHLDQIDRSDPDLCYKYALHLSRKGAGRAKGVIRWADVSLENRFNWTGNTYKTRVYSLYKLKAQAGQRLWQSASEGYNGNPSPDNKAKMEKARNQTKVMAREWLDYAREAGKDHTKALQLCVSAAGTDDYCGGG